MKNIKGFKKPLAAIEAEFNDLYKLATAKEFDYVKYGSKDA